MYERETRLIHVAVKPAYLDDQSDPDDRRYVWSYTVTIENRGAEPVQLISRYWNITDGIGRIQEVRGPGVVGQQPTLQPGEEFRYSSACPLSSPVGTMHGSFQMKTAGGDWIVWIDDNCYQIASWHSNATASGAVLPQTICRNPDASPHGEIGRAHV